MPSSTATEYPKKSLPSRSEAVSSAVSLPLAQTVSGLTNTNAAPASLSAPLAPTTMMSPSIATERPKYSRSARVEAVSSAVSLPLAQTVSGLTNTNAAPASLSAPLAPTTMVSPSAATDIPRLSPAAALEAVSLAVSLLLTQPVLGFMNT